MNHEFSRALLIGNFSGHQPSGGSTNAPRPLSINIDNFEEIMARIKPTVSIPLVSDEQETVIELASMSDFEPDRLLELIPTFKRLTELRAELKDITRPIQFPADVGGDLPESTPSVGADETPALPKESNEATVQRLLGRESIQPPASVRPTPGPDITNWLQELVQPHIIPDRDPNRDELVRRCENTLELFLRCVLHDPQFQALESLWRSVHALVSEVDDVAVTLLDLGGPELIANLNSQPDYRNTNLFRLLAGHDQPWSIIALDIEFGADPHDIQVLSALGAIAAELKTPIIASASLRIPGCQIEDLNLPEAWQQNSEGQQGWDQFRKSEMARWIGLVMPRILLRLPYGKKTEPIESFGFEELSSSESHEELLWGSGGLVALRCLLNEQLRSRMMLPDLPTYVYAGNDGPERMSPAEVFLGDRAAGKLMELGVIPILSNRTSNFARFACWQSVSIAPGELAVRI